MKSIDGRAKTVRELMDGAKYTIDFYQREYAWQERQVRELIDDLTGKFLDFYDEGHARHEVENYGHYFLGSVVISHKRGHRFIVDGQQRLTTLTLLLIYLHHLQGEREGRVDVRKLVYSEKFGRKSFNLDVPDRTKMMERLLNDEPVDLNGQSESVRNIAERYANLADHFPEEVANGALHYFVDWLLENVHLVEIEAYSDEDAYTIFETMNDRGLSLSLPEMLKGYVLANIRHEDDQRTVNTLWKAHMQTFKDLGDEEDGDFFKNWLRARHAETIRPGKKGAENKDYERIGSEFHRWVRDQRGRLGMGDSDDFMRFVTRDLDFYAKQAQTIRRAARKPTEGLESIRYNEERGFTLQTQVLLAALEPSDSPEVVRRKLGLVGDFLDIWLARRVWNFRTIAYSSVKYTVFTLTRELRGRSVAELSTYLRDQLDAQDETFARNPHLRLHQQNYRQVRHILARLTHWVDSECGLVSHFDDLVSKGSARPFEIEHIWANHYDRFSEVYAHPADFDQERNRLGGLLLLQRGLNQSLGDKTYEDKRAAYVSKGQNLLARTLHPLAYDHNPGLARLQDRTGLQFRPYDEFGPDEQRERQELYIRLAEWVWNPSRLDLDGIKPPVAQPIGGPAGDEEGNDWSSEDRDATRKQYWRALLAAAAARSDLHANISPTRFHWVGTQRGPYKWSYIVGRGETRAEISIRGGSKDENNALFDALFADKEAIEEAFGGVLEWQRLGDQIASRIACSFHDGGWGDETEWPRLIDRCVDAMCCLFDAIGPIVYPGGLVEQEDEQAKPKRYGERRAFWTALLEHAATRTSLHVNCSPTWDSWIGAGAGRGGLGFNYGVLKYGTRAELYIGTSSAETNKSIFDQLIARRAEAEATYGGPLEWQRKDDQKASRIAASLDVGGWADRASWAQAIPPTVDAMARLERALKPLLDAVEVP